MYFSAIFMLDSYADVMYTDETKCKAVHAVN